VTASLRAVVPMYDEPPAALGDDQSWDAFWAERAPARTTTIRGVVVRIPTGITIAYQRTIREMVDQAGVEGFAPVAAALLRAPDGAEIPDLWARWDAAGMELPELHVITTWAMAHAAGNPLTFAQAVEATRDAGKAPAPTGTP